MPTTFPKNSFAFTRGVPGRPRRAVGDTRALSPQCSVYDGRDRLGSFRRRGDCFEAFDRRGRSLGLYPDLNRAADAIGKAAAS